MPYATSRQLRDAGRSVSEGHVKSAKSLKEQDLFLSHSHLDDAEVNGALSILEEAGASVYVDTHDAQIAALNMSERVGRLRRAIAGCKRLVVLISQNSAGSGWIPWEIGLADGYRGVASVATFPFQTANYVTDWGNREYFAGYPHIETRTATTGGTPEYVVVDPRDGKAWSLAAWLNYQE